ncbi:insulin-degrading enzyme-like [Ctenocephalides felis]|uniref:insulin-degrading enzyme-like n=1 Tax=Ctenocephalides felis TaxID=7515 RepID=UPI000E6E3FA5|nr:insulin-degrading enzyme-like [Ctenocephalides felis]
MPTQFKDSIISSQSTYDKREYRGLILPNEMKVMLVSDSTTTKNHLIFSGFMSDPDELPGLAHFCEHMLFLGTKKYPIENYYQKYLSEHGGSCNAVTDSQETKYFFDITPEHLPEILDIFSQFFIAPLFSESATEREINAVDSEHSKNIPNDMWRSDYIEKILCSPNHPYRKFGTGNKQTLMDGPKQKGINVRDELLKFHNRWYSSNIMTLSILGKESLNDLERLARDLFGSVSNKKVQAQIWPDHPYTKEQFATKTFIQPIKDIRLMGITFPVQDLEPFRKSAPGNYLGHLFGHEGPGSLLSCLKARGWSSSLSCGAVQRRGFGFFKLDADLTEEGVNHVDDIVRLVFQYINLLKKETPQKWIFDESKAINDMNFKFRDKEQPRSYVVYLAKNLMHFKFEEVLCGPSLMTHWDPKLIESIVDEFIPENVRVTVISKQFEDKCTQVDPIYNSKYVTEKYEQKTLHEFKKAGFCDDLKLPPPNEFVPKDFTLLPQENVTMHPAIILDNSQIRLWFKQDAEYLLPKMMVCMRITTPLAYLDPLSCNFTHLFVMLFQDSLNEYAYAAELAGLAWNIGMFNQGLVLSVGGYNDKLDVLLAKVLRNLKDFKVDEKRFNIFLENYVRQLKNFETEQPYQHAVYYLGLILTDNSWTKEQLLDATQFTTFESLRAFLPQLLHKVHIEFLIQGNCNKDRALSLVQETESCLELNKRPPLFAQQLLNSREHKLEAGVQYLYDVPHLYHKSSCTEIYFQCGMQSTEANVQLELLAQIMSEPCFDTLRTKEQLGYIVSCGVRRSNGTQGLRIIVQSEKPPPYVDDRIELFIQNMKNHLMTISNEEFERHKEALAKQRLEKPKTLVGLVQVFWSEITKQQYNFNRAVVEVAHLRTITKEQLLTFFNEQVDSESARRKKLAVYVTSKLSNEENIDDKTEDDRKNNKNKETYTLITDLVKFKNSKEMYSLVQPYINLPSKGAQSKL